MRYAYLSRFPSIVNDPPRRESRSVPTKQGCRLPLVPSTNIFTLHYSPDYSNRVDNHSGCGAGDEEDKVLEVGTARYRILIARIVPELVDRSVCNAQRRSNGDSGSVPEFDETEDNAVGGEKMGDLGNHVEEFWINHIRL
jgi:hypothetical protein